MSRAQKILEPLRESLAVVEERIERDIERYRKGNFTLKADGPVEVKQLSHDFTLGGNLFMLDQLETKEKNEKYKEYFKKCFNRS